MVLSSSPSRPSTTSRRESQSPASKRPKAPIRPAAAGFVQQSVTFMKRQVPSSSSARSRAAARGRNSLPTASLLPLIDSNNTTVKRKSVGSVDLCSMPSIDKVLRRASITRSKNDETALQRLQTDPSLYFCVRKRSVFGRYSIREIWRVIQLFQRLDQDHSCGISPRELRQLQPEFEKIGHQKLSQVFRTIDRDANGQIQLRELLECCFPLATTQELNEMLLLAASGDLKTFLKGETPRPAAKTTDSKQDQDELYVIFCLFDRNHDGFVSQQELLEAFELQDDDEQSPKGMTHADVLAYCHQYDQNGDHVLDFQEFVQLMTP